MIGHLTVLADQARVELFTLLGRSRRLFQQAQTWVDVEGIARTGTRLGDVGVALTSLGPGWVFDPLAQQQRAEDYDNSLRDMRRADQRHRDRMLARAVERLRFGGHTERLLWAVHTA